jgi:hypothetical protein
MKRVPRKAKKKKAKKSAAIRSLRGKYKHLNLMSALIEARKEERQFAFKTPHAISARSLKMLGKSAANLKKGLASTPITEPKRSRRLGALKGWMKIKGDIIHSDMEDDWEVL